MDSVGTTLPPERLDLLAERDSERGLRVTLDLAPLGIAHFAPDGQFLFVNEYLCDVLGYSREALLERTFQEITFADDLPRCLDLTARLVAGTIPRYTHQKRFVRRDGRTTWVRVTVSGARNSDGTIAFFIGMAEDITAQLEHEEQRERLLAQEREARLAAETAAHLRDEVLAVVAHDLRNPVHTIVMSAATLIDLPLPEDQRGKQLALILRAAKGMDRLISDLLDVARMHAGRFSVQRADVNLVELLDDTLELFERQASARSVTLACEGARDLPIVAGDRDRIAQVLSNLVGNSLKFTPIGGRVTIRASHRDAEIHLTVADTGAGISAEDLPRIFDQFWQAAGAKQSGAGLGLAISQGIVDAHGGRIWAESEPGAGTTIGFTLPIAKLS